MSTQDPSPLAIRLLGTFQLVHAGRTLNGFGRPRLQALLAYLLLHGEAPVARQRLAFLFWPDSSEKQAFTNLRNLLHKLRQALPNPDLYLDLSRRTVQWREDAPVELDIAQFENALNAARQAGRAGNPALEQMTLAQAVDAYNGDLLPDLYDDWVLVERERLRKQYEAALVRLVALLEDRREYGPALVMAHKLLRHDPLREETYRLLMRLHALNGDRTAALRVYHACVTVLEEELAAEPSPVTQRAYRRLLRLTQQPEVTPLVQAMVGHTPLVGRQEAWQTLTEAWQRARRGRPGLALIVGEAGIGKTRLAEELLDRARRLGITTANARAYEAEGDMAYAPVADWLRSPVFGPTLEQLDEVWLREVARIVPQVLANRPGLEAPGPLTERWQQRRFFESLARAVLVGTQPLLLHLDDLQWCDGETLAWLGFLLRYDPTAKLLVTATVRSEEIDPDHPLVPWRVALRRSGAITEIPLERLSTADTAALAVHVVGHELNADQAERLYRQTEGNPLFVVETARAQLDADSARPLSSFSPVPLPSRMQAVLEARLARLSPSARKLAGMAAVIGREFTFPVLAAAGDTDENTLVLELEELWQRRIVRDRGTDAYDFSHDKLREVAYAAISPVRLRLLHRKVAEALEVVHVHELDEISGELGVHFQRAGDLARACDYLRRAGDFAAARYANAEAVAFYTRALELTAKDALEARFELLEAREAVYAKSGVSDARRVDLDQMAQVAEGLDQDRRRAQVALRRSSFCHEAGDLVQGTSYAQAALELARAADDVELQAASMFAHARIRRNLVPLEQSRRAHEQALELAQRAGAMGLEATCRSLLAALLVYSGQMPEARQHGQKALALAQVPGDVGARILALNVNGIVERGAGNPYAARSYLLDSLQWARRIGHKQLEALLVGNLGGCHNLLGDLDGAQAWFDQAALLADETGYQMAHIAYMQYKSGTLYQLGRYEEGLDLALRGLSYARTNDDRREEAIAWVQVGMLQAALGQVAVSVQSFGQARRLAQELGDRLTEWEALAGLARAQLAQGDLAEATALVDLILPSILEGPRTHTETYAPMTLFLTCCQVLDAVEDPRARLCLQAGYREVQAVADRIPDLSLRHSFLENIREVRAIVDAAQGLKLAER